MDDSEILGLMVRWEGAIDECEKKRRGYVGVGV